MGEIGHVRQSSADASVLGFLTKEADDAFTRAALANDTIGLIGAAAQAISIEPGTRALVLERSWVG